MEIPIFIAVKGLDEDNIKKNKELLVYAYSYLEEHQIIDKCHVISDDQVLCDFAKTIGFQEVWLDDAREDASNLELYGIKSYIEKNKMQCEWLISFNISRPFKSRSLLFDIINRIDDSYDFITSYVNAFNRSIFFLNDHEDEFIDEPLDEFKPNLQQVRMVDSSIFAIKKVFLDKIMKNSNPYKDIWKANFCTVEHDTLYMHVKTYNDIRRLKHLEKIFSKVHQVKSELKI